MDAADTRSGWREYWNADNPIYVNERHQQLHCSGIADDLIRLVGELCPAPGTAAVLDFGCGRALEAHRVAAACGRLVLADSASRVLEELRQRFAAHPRVEVWPADGLDGRFGAEFDLVIVNSVIQYLTPAELDALLVTLRGLLKPNGHLVVADVIPRDTGALTDARALLGFAARGGLLVPAVVGLARTAFSDYRKLRSRLGIAQYDEAEMLKIFATRGYTAGRHPKNLGHNPARMTFVATPA